MKRTRFDTIIHAPIGFKSVRSWHHCRKLNSRSCAKSLDVSDSVLSKHIRQLEEAGYAEQRKSTVDGRQRTWVSLTKVGRTAFEQHVEELKRLVLFQKE